MKFRAHGREGDPAGGDCGEVARCGGIWGRRLLCSWCEAGGKNGTDIEGMRPACRGGAGGGRGDRCMGPVICLQIDFLPSKEQVEPPNLHKNLSKTAAKSSYLNKSTGDTVA